MKRGQDDFRIAPGRLHATGVRLQDKGVLICGASGTGKSSLALRLLGLGADLIADDQINLEACSGSLTLSRPSGAPMLIEARGVGLLEVACVESAPLSLVVSLDVDEDQRLPPLRWARIETAAVPLLHNVKNGTFPWAIRQYLKHGRSDPDP